MAKKEQVQVQEQSNSFMVMASLYEAKKLNKSDIEPHWEFKTLRRGPKIVKRAWAMRQNEGMKNKDVGKRWEFDEEATIEFQIKSEEASEKRKKEKVIRDKNAQVFKDAINNI